MSKLLVVFGATGQQGGSVVNCVINDSELSKTYKVRGVTRDPSKGAAKALKQKGVEIVKGDLDNTESLEQALCGAHTVFAVTTTDYDDRTKEIAQGKTVADMAVAAGVQYFIFSTLPHVGINSGGKYTHCYMFDYKAIVEDYIRGLPMKSAFFAPGAFMSNFTKMMAPYPAGDGTYIISNTVTPQTEIPLLNVAADAGKYVCAILAEPANYEGKVLSAATRLYSFGEAVQIISKLSGKTITYKQLPNNAFRLADHAEMLLYFQDFGYYGENTKEKVEWTARNARGRLTTFEEYIAKNPPKFK
ncbi:hypothetical protein GP486_005619 [Trichoglossum hirsutum]|uniref:NmrA-like domain-containing protein n=1 Tax=Trichoglossum hirsutum TaxID=265104 RepID=A0A9P8L8U3_9PEZI|nr:hypothetical protein GP486_005619 [Trichoglossum hirsutum]